MTNCAGYGSRLPGDGTHLYGDFLLSGRKTEITARSAEPLSFQQNESISIAAAVVADAELVVHFLQLLTALP